MRGRVIKKILLNVSCLFLGIIFTGRVIALENAGAINTALGVKTYEIVSRSEEESDEYVHYYPTVYGSIKELKEAGYAKAQEVEAEGAVLLKNDHGTLPLAKGEVSVFGITSVYPVYAGTGSGSVSTSEAPKFKEGLERAGFTVNAALTKWYEESEYSRSKMAVEKKAPEGEDAVAALRAMALQRPYIGEAPWDKVTEGAGAFFGHGEAAIYCIGRVGGEGADVRVETQVDGTNGDYLRLNQEELDTLRGLKALKDSGKIASITLLINSANPIAMDFIDDEEYGVDAALWIGSVGQTGLYAVGEILSGAVNPSGKLPDTWWMDNRQNPAVANFGVYEYEDFSRFSDLGTEFNRYVVYQEGLYVGYKYTETRYEDVVQKTPGAGNFDYTAVVAYPFGYGLSYTDFRYSDLTVTKTGSGRETAYEVSVKVTNSGSVAGKEAVQIFLQKPYTDYDRAQKIEKAAVELAGFAKTGLLAPGEAETVTVHVPEYFFTSFDTFGEGTYVLDAGTYYLTAGKDAHDAINNILAAKGKTGADGMTKAGETPMSVGEKRQADGSSELGNPALVQALSYEFDAQTYAKAMGTGNPVAPLFSECDINTYSGRETNAVTYLSRQDWEGTLMLWEDRDGDGANDNFIQLKATPQLIEDVVLDEADIPEDPEGLEFPTYGSTETTLQLIDLRVDENGDVIAYDDPVWDSLLDQLTFTQTAKLCATGLRMTIDIPEIGKPRTLDHNGPGGVTQRYGYGQSGYAVLTNDPDQELTGTCFPCNGILAATRNTALMEEAGEIIGEDGMWAGYAGFYGSGLNIHRTPYAGRVFEYYSEDAILTGLIDAAETKGIQSKGLYVYNKHFVVNDQENNRAGIGTWVNEQALRENYLRAFELPILYADAKCVMSAFNRIGAIWAAASEPLMTGWLRGEAGMSGFAVTDMYNAVYMSKPHMVLAGNDIPDHYPGRGLSEITDERMAAEYADYGPDGLTPSATLAWRMRESAHRVLYTVLHSRGMDGITPGSTVVPLTPWWETLLNVLLAVFALCTVLSGIWLLADIIRHPEK